MKAVVNVAGVQAQRVQRGASLIMVMIVLSIVSLLGIAGIQVSMMSERGARNERDQAIAWQAAETALLDASKRLDDAALNITPATFPTAGCGTSGASKGLCKLEESGKPAWLVVDLTQTGNAAPVIQTGTYVASRTGSVGPQSSKTATYVIEPIPFEEDKGLNCAVPTACKHVYRVTAMGFGPRDDIQAVMQMIYRKQ